ncbi:hypothetical protein D3C84_1142510 [compost metagenome]
MCLLRKCFEHMPIPLQHAGNIGFGLLACQPLLDLIKRRLLLMKSKPAVIFGVKQIRI